MTMTGTTGADPSGRASSDAVVQHLWDARRQPSRGPKRSLSLLLIAAATVTIADAEGLEVVSMQRVAAELRVTKMALYRYVTGKAELLAIAVEAAVDVPPDLSAVAGGWRARVETWARLLRDVWQRHPWLPGATLGDRAMGPREVAWIECVATALTGIGLDPAERLGVVHILCGLVRTTTTAGSAGTQPWTLTDATGAALRERLRQHGDDYPTLLAAIPPSTAAPTAMAEIWELGIRLLLDGLQVALDERAAHGGDRS